MRKLLSGILVGMFAVATLGVSAVAQSTEVKEKPPMYSYVGNWSIPRAQWGDVAKLNAADKALLDKAMAAGTLVGYGNDESLVHVDGDSTHDSWWSSMSMAGLINVLDQFYSSGTVVAPVLNNATKHWDNIYVSKYYNWRPGAFKGYTRVGVYKLKKDAPDDALELLSKSMIVPMLEKMLQDGTLIEYEIDEQAIHTEAPGTFLIVMVCSNPDGLDKFMNALNETRKTNPLGGPAFSAMMDSSAHRDSLARTTGVYK